jgi:hypothetical protein
MKYLTTVFTIAFLIVACTQIPMPSQSPVFGPSTLPPNAPVTGPPQNGSTPMETPDMPFAPKPNDTNLTRGNVFINESGLLIRESFPPQITLSLSGDLPTPCHELRVDFKEPDSENKINAELYSVVDPDQVCIQVLEPFQANIDLGTFPSGHYTVWVNGEKAGEFDT